MKPPKIKAILAIFWSTRDRAGNVYWAFRWTDTMSGKSCEGTISGGESNLTWVPRELGFENGEYYYYLKECSKREFQRVTAEMEYAGCPPEQIAEFIRTCMTKQGVKWYEQARSA